MSAPRRLALAAPAKLNLGLRVVGRRPDGYHELESVFVPLDLADEIDVAVSDGDEVRLELVRGEAPGVDAVPEGETNLAVRAARALLGAAGARAAVHLRLTKRIPAGAGLGGGSSDAGAVLRALAALLPLPHGIDAARLEALALDLGADVPFFLDPRPAFVEGVGERRTPLPGWPALGVLLAHPGTPLDTGAVFRARAASGAALTPPRAGSTILRLRALRGASPAELVEALRAEAGLRNDLEGSAVRLVPALAELREEVEATGARATGMSGSGPVVFGLFADVRQAREAARRMGARREGRTWVAATLPSPPDAAEPGLGSAWGVAKW